MGDRSFTDSKQNEDKADENKLLSTNPRFHTRGFMKSSSLDG